jgi:site-specific recombinase
MLGLTPAAGALLGLPLDIRHVAFSSANLGYALAATDFAPPAGMLARACAGVALIGLINLAVSFGLALWVAMRSQGIGVARLAPVLPRLAARLRREPRSFLAPPPASLA